MSEGLMTEREWRRQYVRRVGKRSNCWGAQCWRPRPRWTQSRRCRMLLLAGAWTAALLLPMLVPRGTAREYNLPLAAEAAVPSPEQRNRLCPARGNGLHAADRYERAAIAGKVASSG